MAAKIYNAPGNPFRRGILRSVGAGGAKVSAEGGRSAGKPANPMLGALGDPSLNQTFSGPAAGFAQFGQTMAQRKLYQQEMAGQEEAMQAFSEKLQMGVDTPKALTELLTENPRHYMALERSGLLESSQRLGSWMQQAQLAGRAGEMKQFQVGDHTVAEIIGPDAKPHYINVGPGNQRVTSLGAVNAQGEPLVGDNKGNIKALTGAMPSSAFNQSQKPQATQLVPITLPDGKQGFMRVPKTGETGVVEMPPGVTAGKPPALTKWDHRDNEVFGSFKSVMDALPVLEKNVGASMPVIGGVLGQAAKLGLGGPQTKDYQAALDTLTTSSQALSTLNPRLKASYETMLKVLPKLGQSEDYNRDEALPNIRWAARQQAAGFVEYLGAARKEVPEGLQAMIERNRADPKYMTQLEAARSSLLSAPGMLTNDQIQLLSDKAEQKYLPLSAQFNLVRQQAARGLLDPKMQEAYKKTVAQHPELAKPLRPEEQPAQAMPVPESAAGQPQ